MLAPAAMMQAGFTSLPHSGWKMKALDFFVSLEDDIPFAAALSQQAEMVHYYPQYSTPYLVPQQVHSSDHENVPGPWCESLLDLSLDIFNQSSAS